MPELAELKFLLFGTFNELIFVVLADLVRSLEEVEAEGPAEANVDVAELDGQECPGVLGSIIFDQ